MPLTSVTTLDQWSTVGSVHSVESGSWCGMSIVCINMQLSLQCSIGHTTTPVIPLDVCHKDQTSYFSSHWWMWLSLLAYTTFSSLLVVGFLLQLQWYTSRPWHPCCTTTCIIWHVLIGQCVAQVMSDLQVALILISEVCVLMSDSTAAWRVDRAASDGRLGQWFSRSQYTCFQRWRLLLH